MEHANDKYRKVLFVHDGPMYEDDAGNVYGIHFKEDIKERYLNLGDSVTFCMRSQKIRSEDKSKYSLIKPDQFRFVSFPNFKTIRSYFFRKPVAKQIIYNEVRNHDILVARMPSASGTMAIRAAQKYNVPYLAEYVACTFDAYWNYNWKGKLIAHYKMWEQKKVIKNVPYVIYVTNQFLQHRYPNLGENIGCSDVELPKYQPKDLIDRVKKIKNRGANEPIKLATVAALDVPYKGQDDVIKAINLLKKQGKHFHYYLVGQGNPDYLMKLTKMLGLNEEIKFIGALPHERVFELLEEIDVYIQPSKQEGLPRAMIEAMSKACPALGARTAGIPELVSDDCIFTPGDVSEIIEQLSAINCNWMIAQAERNFKEAEKYQHHLLEEKRLSFYREFLSKNSSLIDS